MKMCVCVWFGTCAYGILHVAVIQLPLSEQEEVIRLRSTPGIVHKTIVWRGCIFLKQPSECKCCLITADGLTLHSTILYSVHSVWSLSFKILTSAPEQAINNIEKLLLKTKKIYSRYICKVNCNILPQTSSLWLCSAVTSSPARGNFQQDVQPTRRASLLAVVGSFSPPPDLLSADRQ